MNKFKEFICKLFHIETYKDKYESCKKQLEEVWENYDIALCVIESYKEEAEEDAKEIERLRGLCTEPLKVIEEEVNVVTEQYEKCLADINNLVESEESMKNRAFSEGRAAAYSEMGIWRLDALERGNILAMDKEGNVVEVFNNLEDIECTDDINPESANESDMNGEIVIEDLIEEY